MFKKNASKKVAALVAAFPPILMLVYALVTYTIFLTSQEEQNRDILNLQKNRFEVIVENILKTTADTTNNYVNKVTSKEEALKLLTSIKRYGNAEIVVFDTRSKRVVFKSAKGDNSKLFNLLYTASGKQKFSNILAIERHNNKLGLKIITYYDTNTYKEHLIQIQKQLDSTTHKIVKKNLFWLAISWFTLLFFSFVLATIILNKLRKYENEIRASNENIIFQSRQALLGELLPMIAHQWRQPINKIAAVLMRIRFELANNSPNVDTLDRQAQQIEDSVELMSNTIDDFRSFYRPKEEAEYVDLALLIRKAIYFLDELLERKKIKIKNDLSPIEVKLHANEFLQVIINLVKNASDAVGVKGQIAVSLRELKGGSVEIRVEDNGTGIPQDKLEKIFDPHESTKQGSMGLGLYMSKLIIESHFGGIIKAYNTPRGAGFLIRLPKDGNQ